MFKVGLYDDQPNKTTGSGIGPAESFSDFRVSGMRGTISSVGAVPSRHGSRAFDVGDDARRLRGPRHRGIPPVQ